jgi:hypothetical protein
MAYGVKTPIVSIRFRYGFGELAVGLKYVELNHRSMGTCIDCYAACWLYTLRRPVRR